MVYTLGFDVVNPIFSSVMHRTRNQLIVEMGKIKSLQYIAVCLLTMISSVASAQQIPDFVKVDGGTFVMGDAYGDLDEKPYEVTVGTFYIGATEISVGQFRQYCQETGDQLPHEYKDAPHDNEPIRHVNIFRAKKYCEWLSEKLGKKIQLPTEAQWEFAARGGLKSEGNRFVKGAAVLGQGSNGGQLHYVGSKQPNELGLYDMGENVWEWTRTYYGDYPTEAQINPLGPKEGNVNVIRGGSYLNDEAPYSRVADRSSYMDHYAMHDVGFRVMYEADAPMPKPGKLIKTSTDTTLMRQLPYEGVQHFAKTKDRRIQWFKEAKLGMFIHWGLYSAGGGYYRGQRYNHHYAEWIQVWSGADTKDYAEHLGPGFTAEDYDPKKWAKLAKHIGARYAVLTSKHHDGFTLFNTKHPYARKENNPYAATVNISPQGRDLFGEYVEAFREANIKVGLYYSLIDWQHPDSPFHYELNNAKRTNKTADYLDYYKSHVKQLMTEYGKIDLMWSDYSSASKQGKTWDTKGLLEMIAQEQPDIVVSNRFWNGIENPYGDYITPEKYVPATGFDGDAWEVCHTMNESFGYSAHDNHWKSPEELFKILVDVNSKGGNLLLNIGPDAKGNVPDVAMDILNAFGNMVQKYESEIFETTASQFSGLPFEGKSNTVLTEGKGSRLNFFVYKYPADGKMLVKGIENKVSKVYLSASKKQLEFSVEDGVLSIDLPKEKTDSFGWVVSVDLKGRPRVVRVP